MNDSHLIYDDVMIFKTDLERMLARNEIDFSQFEDILNDLNEYDISITILEKTSISIVLENLNEKCQVNESSKKVKDILQKWNKPIPKDLDKIKKQFKPLNFEIKHRDEHLKYLRGIEDPIRLKCREMLAKALESAHNPKIHSDLYETAAKCEDSIYSEFKATNSRYKNRIRSRILNLTDEKNPKLREHVLSGEISAAKLAKMSSEEMESDELKHIRDEITKDALNEHQLAHTEGFKSSFINCPECNSNSIRYSDIQVKTEDEITTSYVDCTKCGHRWNADA